MAAGAHVRLLAGTAASGRPVREEVPARALGAGRWHLSGSPALVEGCAAGDVLQVEDDGSFRVVERGGNLALVSYADPGRPVSPDDAARLREVATSLGGQAEVPQDGRFAVVTVPVTAGFEAVEAAMDAWASRTGRAWSWSNVHDASGRPLGWW